MLDYFRPGAHSFYFFVRVPISQIRLHYRCWDDGRKDVINRSDDDRVNFGKCSWNKFTIMKRNISLFG